MSVSPAPVFANERISPKDRNALRGAIRRAFARSDLRESVMAAARIEHSDPAKPRCKKWIRCAECQKPAPEWSSQVDHIEPVIPVDSTFEEMGLDKFATSCWCDPTKMQAICKGCHDVKTQREKDERIASQVARGLRAPPKPKKAKRAKAAKE